MIVAKTERCGSWWAVELPLTDTATHYTQGKTLDEAERMARDVVRVFAQDKNMPELLDQKIRLEIVGEASAAAACVERAREDARQATEHMHAVQTSQVKRLRAQGLQLADIGRLLGLTKGRISQIVRA